MWSVRERGYRKIYQYTHLRFCKRQVQSRSEVLGSEKCIKNFSQRKRRHGRTKSSSEANIKYILEE